MGFRGEALASMTYVGHVTVTTITEGQLHGYRLVCLCAPNLFDEICLGVWFAFKLVFDFDKYGRMEEGKRVLNLMSLYFYFYSYYFSKRKEDG